MHLTEQWTRRALGRVHYLRQRSLSDSSVNICFAVFDLDLWPWASTVYSALPCRRRHQCTKFRQNLPYSIIWAKSGYGYSIPTMICIAPEIKCSLLWFTGNSFIKIPWNLSITFSTIRCAILNTCPNTGSELWPRSSLKPNQILQTPAAIDAKILSKSVHNFFRYPVKFKNPV